MTPPPSVIRHQDVIGRIYLILQPHAESRDLGRVWLSPVGVQLPSGDAVEPDLVYVAGERWASSETSSSASPTS